MQNKELAPITGISTLKSEEGDEDGRARVKM